MTLSRRDRSFCTAGTLVLSIALISCGKASEGQDSNDARHMTSRHWQTICLDRFLIDVPAVVHMGATEARYKGTYGFDGINDIGTRGVKWGAVTIDETPPTTTKAYADVRDSASASMTTAEGYADWFKEQEEAIRYEKKRAESGTPAEIAAMKAMLANSKKSLKNARYSFKISGKAKLSDPQAFAFRRGDDYTIGYLDAVDKQLRVFEGTITQRHLESPEAAAYEYRRLQSTYHRRSPTDIPTTPGFCTPFGFLDEESGPEHDTSLEIPFRSLKYPNLIFSLTVIPADPEEPRNIQKLPNMDAERADLHLVGIKDDYGPVGVNILGTPGRSIGFAYGPNCYRKSCRPADQAYEFEAETFGVPGRPDQPRLKLHMIAVTSDDYKLKNIPDPRDPSYNTPRRPALSGHVPPSFVEGTKIFEAVLRSIRPRPGAIATPKAVAPATGATDPGARR